MFSSFGWGEFFLVLVIGLIVIGPERLPSVIEDVRAAIYAARKAIANAKKELNGELEEFSEFKQPLDTVSRYAAMGPKRAVSSLLFEGDEDYLGSFDPRRVLEEADEEPRVNSGPRPAPKAGPKTGPKAAPTTPPEQKQRRDFSWEDVT